MTSDLDSRLRHAADALRRAPAEPPTHPPRPGHPLRVGALAMAVLALVVGAMTFLRPSGGNDAGSLGDGDVAIQEEVQLPRLMPDWVPEGFNLGGASDPDAPGSHTTLPSGVPEAQSVTHDVRFGDPEADDGFGRIDLSVGAHRTSPDTEMGYGWDELSEPITVRGHAGTVCRQPACVEVAGGTTLNWEDDPGLFITMGATTFDADQLLAIAEGLSFPDDIPTLDDVPSEIPGPLVEMERQTWGASAPNPPDLWLTYVGEDGYLGGPALSVTTKPGDESTIRSAFRGIEDRRPVTVRGHGGWMGSTEPTGDCTSDQGCSHGSVRVAWQEAPGVVIEASSLGTELAEADFLRFLESLRPATDAEWAEAVALMTPAPSEDIVADVTALIPPDALASVNTDGMGSAAYLTADGRLCGFVLDRVDGQLPEVCGPADERVLVLEDRNGNMHTLIGRLPEGAREVAAMVEGREEQVMNAFLDGTATGGSSTIYALAPAGVVPDELRFSADGQVLETVPLDFD